MYRKAVIFAALAAEAVAFAPSSAFGGLRLKSSTAASASTSLRRNAATPSIARMKAQLADKEAPTSVDEFKKDGKSMSLLEKEQLYLDCCAEWNVNQKELLGNDDYETLKEDLVFEGSQVMLMTREEIKYLVAAMRYNKGQPIMDDKEYNELQTKLRKEGSLAVKHDAASCKLTDDGVKKCKADLFPDDGKNALLYSPALVLSALLFNEWAFWFQGWDPILSLVLGSPFIAAATYGLTNYIYFQQPYITKTICPDCGTPQNIFFGDVLFVSGKPVTAIVDTKCVNKDCAVKLQADKQTMRVEAIFDK